MHCTNFPLLDVSLMKGPQNSRGITGGTKDKYDSD
jgi:hypothetical protein